MEPLTPSGGFARKARPQAPAAVGPVRPFVERRTGLGES